MGWFASYYLRAKNGAGARWARFQGRHPTCHHAHCARSALKQSTIASERRQLHLLAGGRGGGRRSTRPPLGPGPKRGLQGQHAAAGTRAAATSAARGGGARAGQPTGRAGPGGGARGRDGGGHGRMHILDPSSVTAAGGVKPWATAAALQRARCGAPPSPRRVWAWQRRRPCWRGVCAHSRPHSRPHGPLALRSRRGGRGFGQRPHPPPGPPGRHPTPPTAKERVHGVSRKSEANGQGPNSTRRGVKRADGCGAGTALCGAPSPRARVWHAERCRGVSPALPHVPPAPSTCPGARGQVRQ